MDPVTVMILIGLIIITGYISSLLFERTKIPDLIILIGLGLLLGPILGVFDAQELGSASQYIAALALIVIMFEGGLGMRLYEVFKESPTALVLALTSFTLTLIFVGAYCWLILGWEPLVGLLLGAIIGGSSSMVVIPVLQTMGVTSGPGVVLNLESAMTDGLCIVMAFTILQILSAGGGADTAAVVQSVASQFSVGIVVGLVGGIIWLRILHSIKGMPYDYMLSFAILFLTYGLAETFGGNGAMAILVFGIVMGNSTQIGNIFRMKNVVAFGGRMREFHSQITFFVKTFFFVYLGLLTSLSDMNTIFAGLGVLLMVIVARFFAVKINARKEPAHVQKLMTLMMGRGLAAAVLATLPIGYGIANGTAIADFASIVIIGTAITTTLGVFTWNPPTPENKTETKTNNNNKKKKNNSKKK